MRIVLRVFMWSSPLIKIIIMRFIGRSKLYLTIVRASKCLCVRNETLIIDASVLDTT